MYKYSYPGSNDHMYPEDEDEMDLLPMYSNTQQVPQVYRDFYSRHTRIQLPNPNPPQSNSPFPPPPHAKHITEIIEEHEATYLNHLANAATFQNLQNMQGGYIRDDTPQYR